MAKSEGNPIQEARGNIWEAAGAGSWIIDNILAAAEEQKKGHGDGEPVRVMLEARVWNRDGRKPIRTGHCIMYCIPFTNICVEICIIRTFPQ